MDTHTSIVDSNLEGTCRACLVKSSSLSLFVAIYNEGETFNLWEVFENCTNIQVDENDKLPKAVCEDCLNELISVYYFIKKCKSSNDALRAFAADISNDVKLGIVEELPNCDIKTSKTSATKIEELDEKDIKLSDIVCSQSLTDNTEINTLTSDSQLDLQDNIFENNLESLVDDGEIVTEQMMKQLMEENDGIEKDLKQLLDPELLSRENIEIKHMVLKSEYKSNYERKRAWRERNKTKFHCNICFKPCSSQTRLTEHIRTHTKERPYKCDKCQASFTLYCNLTRHRRVHTGEKPYVCNLCNKGFTQSSSLSSHMRLHTGDKPYLCRCGKSFHPDTHCPYSLRRYFTKDPNARKTKRHDMCKECGTIYTALCFSNKHTVSDDDKRFLCSICGKEFVSKMGLGHHYRIHTGERPYKCEMCEKSFKNSTALRMHHLTHTGERPCICKICGKCFIQPAHLRYHLLIHTGVKEYACIYCSKAFALKGNLTQHLRTHTDETPYQCPHCFKGFRTSNSLKKHQKLHNNLKLDMIENSNTYIETV